MTDVPVIFCFDNRILTGAGVSILSMIDAANEDTNYIIHVFHPGLNANAVGGLKCLVHGTRHTIEFHKIRSERFVGAPRNRGSWTEVVYFRLLAAEVLPDCDKAIYSDVDVFFKRDLQEIFQTDLTGFEWAGVAAEENGPDTIMHRYFPENKKENIFFSGFMIMNLVQMRNHGAVDRYLDAIRKLSNRLKFFDLDILNVASDSILRVPFEYVTLEDVYEVEDVTQSVDYQYLRSVYSPKELEQARDNPAIIHFAGRRGKPWQRRRIPDYFQQTSVRLPASLRKGTFRDFRKRWLSRKGRRQFPQRAKSS